MRIHAHRHHLDIAPFKLFQLLAEGVQAGEVVVTDGQLRLLPGMRAEAKGPPGAPSADSKKTE